MPAAAAAAAATGLIEFSARTRFCHPLARSAVYRHADAAERRAAHRTLAEVTDPKTDPDRRAWHRAQAVTGPDEEVATELERAASLARSRGGMAAAAAFLERAAALSLNHASRIGRTLDAAQAHLDSGGTDTAEALLTAIENATMDTPQHARLDLLRGRISFLKSHDGSGPKFMLRAARRLDETDPRRARDYLVDAFEMGLAVGRASGVLDMILATAPATSAEPDVLDGLLVFAAKGPRAAVPLLRKLLDDTGDPLWTRRPALAVILAAELWDPDGHAAIVRRLVQTGRESGSPIVLRLGLAQTAFHAVLDGDIERAMTSIAEEEAIADATRGPAVTYHRLQLAAMRGRRDEALDLMRRPNQLTTSVHWASALLHNGLGDYPAALAAAQRAIAQSDLFLAGLALPELVEAAVRSGEQAAAAAALDALVERTEPTGTAMGMGITAYARGLVTGTEDDYREAIELLDKTSLLPYRGRAHLLYGEWLRREGRRRDCRRHLRIAHELLAGHGIDAFAKRAADELRATGEKARGRSESGHDELTMQELYIAREVATGATSQEIATRLFLSPRTIEAHLRNIFRKLGITSRRQLRDHPSLTSES
ncbi:hypothetical protein Pflav_075840 [Phytohabitans flavus]|uniref:HTH luxR-type domain-containing protein n=1 Tax=Phytohabitans flavus TaxID=1076124 RepID=A0A6F8Y4X0_9ACTN|nr:helix-turn-helix transcriptional regulator [Phytohabitans flavus]BCB81174.1 hypothetical protein Pflav_075840 [Phytohabitans flavus]